MIKILYMCIIAHMIGDYALQCDFIAQTKGKNIYHLLVHCFLYSLPFAMWFGFDYRIALILVTHFVIDMAKARYKTISYASDQVLHYIALMFLYVVPLWCLNGGINLK